jgi:carbamate kinase
MSKIVIALGGNALMESGDSRDYETQVRRAVNAFESLTDIIVKEDVIITHGNGPQVGDLILRNQYSKELPPPMPMHTLGAMSQGLIGEILIEAYENVRSRSGIGKEAINILTRTIVDKNDRAFMNPTKPVGRVYSDQEYSELKNSTDWEFIRTEKGWRRCVPSPMPLDILEKNAILSSLNAGFLPICTGGGGIPVIKTGNYYSGVNAVIDKDLASYVLAHMLEAEEFVILTDVKNAFIDFGKSTQKSLNKVKLNEIKKYYDEGQFSTGSMGPKVLAAMSFVEHGGKVARIGSLKDANNVIEGTSGTIIQA